MKDVSDDIVKFIEILFDSLKKYYKFRGTREADQSQMEALNRDQFDQLFSLCKEMVIDNEMTSYLHLIVAQEEKDTITELGLAQQALAEWSMTDWKVDSPLFQLDVEAYAKVKNIELKKEVKNEIPFA